MWPSRATTALWAGKGQNRSFFWLQTLGVLSGLQGSHCLLGRLIYSNKVYTRPRVSLWPRDTLALSRSWHENQLSCFFYLTVLACNQTHPESGLPQITGPSCVELAVHVGQELETHGLLSGELSSWLKCLSDKLQPKLAHLRRKNQVLLIEASGCPPPSRSGGLTCLTTL